MSQIARIENGIELYRLTLPCGLPQGSVSMPGRLTESMFADGWRDVVSVDDRANIKAATWTDNGSQWVEIVTRWTAAELAQQAADAAAAQAAAESNRLATPIKFDQPIQGRFETPADDGHVYGLEVDVETGELYPVQRESTRKTDAEYAAAKADEKGKRTTRKADRAALKTAIQAIDPSAFTGTQKTAVKAIVDALKELRRIEARE